MRSNEKQPEVHQERQRPSALYQEQRAYVDAVNDSIVTRDGWVASWTKLLRSGRAKQL